MYELDRKSRIRMGSYAFFEQLLLVAIAAVNGVIVDYIHMFNICKELTIVEYKAMRANYRSGSDEAFYLDDQIGVLKRMTYDNYAHSFATPYSSFWLH